MSDYITFPYEDEEGYRAWLEKQPDDTCPACGGSGCEIVCTGQGEHGDCEQQMCPECDGAGKRLFAPVECVQCKAATGPIAKIDAEHPGWLCPVCYGKLQDRDELPEHDPDDLEDGCGGTGILHCFCGGDFCACGDDEVECPGCEDCENADSEW